MGSRLAFDWAAIASRMASGAIVLTAVTSSGCNNACQEICGRMVNYAEDCNIDVPDSEIDTCIEEQAESTDEELKTCRQNGSAEDIRAAWTCEQLAEYWAGGGTVPPPEELRRRSAP